MTIASQAEIRRPAPAKLNLTLEILGRREDGYHEIRSVMTAVSLCDQVIVGEGRGVLVTAAETYNGFGLPDAGEENSVEHALRLLAQRRPDFALGADAGPQSALQHGLEYAAIRLRKEIPASAGLGGGSSDATATLLALNDYWRLGLTKAELCHLAAQIGSDCPFFVQGGVQLVEGRGERLRPLPSPVTAWFCLLTPPIRRRDKTRLLYSLLLPAHYSSGAQSRRLAMRLREVQRSPLGPDDLCNVFDQVADQAYGDLTPFREALAGAGATSVHCCGAGPSLYGLFPDEASCRAAEAALRCDGFDAWAVSSLASG